MIDTAHIQYAEEGGEKRGEQRGIELGIQQGVEQGMEQGMLRGEREVLLRLMSRHIGEVPASIATRLETLTLGQLRDLVEVFFDLSSYSEIEAWLSRQ